VLLAAEGCSDTPVSLPTPAYVPDENIILLQEMVDCFFPRDFHDNLAHLLSLVIRRAFLIFSLYCAFRCFMRFMCMTELDIGVIYLQNIQRNEHKYNSMPCPRVHTARARYAPLLSCCSNTDL